MPKNENRYLQKDNELLGVFCNRKEHDKTIYTENVKKAFANLNDTRVKKRIEKMLNTFPGSLWFSEKHRMNMSEAEYNLGYHQHRNTRSYYAALYLMLVNSDLVEKSSYCFYRDGLDFSKLYLRGISLNNYILLMAAKQLFVGEKYISFDDLADPEVIDDETFRLIMNALLIKIMGISVFSR